MRGCLALVAIVLAAGCTAEPAPPSTAAPASTPAPQTAPAPDTSPAASAPSAALAQDGGPATAWIGPLPPMPFADYPAGRPPEAIKAVYEYAARHPEVLHYVPCFCGCERGGHRNNDDCFVSGREPNGRPIWEPHGAT
jgi:uncharacterized protein with PCYCGC motif